MMAVSEFLSVLRILFGLAILTPAFYLAWTYPVAPIEIVIGLLLYLVVLLRYPAAWLVVIPAAIPVVELGFWSGRIYLTEFDLLLLVTLGSVLLRRHITLRSLNLPLSFVAGVLLLYNLFVTWKGLFPLYPGGLGMWNDRLSSLNSLHEAKGFFSAFLLLPLLLTEHYKKTYIARLFTIGMISGLVIVAATIIWERLLFTELLNFTNTYRISGMFFGTLTGGAAVDAYLIIVTPFVGALILTRPSVIKLSAVAVILCLAAYCLYVTYSRANYPAAFAAALVFFAGAWWVSSWRIVLTTHHVTAVLAVFFLGGSAAYYLLIGTTISNRFEQTLNDMQVRIDHWSYAAKMVGAEPNGKWIGAGRGVYPLKYYTYSILTEKPLVVPTWTQTRSESFITLTPGDDSGVTYLRQRLELSGDNRYRLKIKARAAPNQHERLLIEFCERHVLKFRRECTWRRIRIPQGSTQWREYNVRVNLGHLGKKIFGFGPLNIGRFARPVDISILNRGIKRKIDIGSVNLYRMDGKQILRNNEFRNGLDHWYFSYGNHLRWHIKNVFVYTYFEGGAVGLVVLIFTLIVVASRLVRAIVLHDAFAVLLGSALAGLFFIGLFDSLFDEPRIALLFTLLVWFSLLTPFQSGTPEVTISKGPVS